VLSSGVGVDIDYAQPDSGATTLHFAAENDVSELLELLLAKGAKTELVTQDRMAGRGDYVSGGLTALHLAAFKGKADNCRLLLKHGANAAAQDWCGRSPAIHALQWGHTALAELLHAAASSQQSAAESKSGAAAAAAGSGAASSAGADSKVSAKLPSADEVRAMKLADRDAVRGRMQSANEARKRAVRAKLGAF
jgi:ankyrin repeat protein